MDTVLPLLLIAVGFAAALLLLTRLAVRARRGGGSGSGIAGALAAYEEAVRGTSHAAHVEIRAEAERRTPLLSPDDQWTPSTETLGARAPRQGGGRLRRGLRLRRRGR